MRYEVYDGNELVNQGFNLMEAIGLAKSYMDSGYSDKPGLNHYAKRLEVDTMSGIVI